jgi:hypothetical protein
VLESRQIRKDFRLVIKRPKKAGVKFVLCLFLFGMVSRGGLAQALPQVPATFTIDGTFFTTPSGPDPLLDSAVSLRIQILDPGKVCVLYEETQVVNTQTSNGAFTIQVGSLPGSSKRTSGASGDPGNSLPNIFSNAAVITAANTGSCGAGYTPAVGAGRVVRLLVTPRSGSSDTLDLSLDSVPMAMVSERSENLQGFGASSFLQVNTTGSEALSQANLENIFTTTGFANLQSLIAFPASHFVQTGSNGSAALPTVSGDPSSGLSAGQIWYDSTANTLKYYNGSVAQTLGTAGAGL